MEESTIFHDNGQCWIRDYLWREAEEMERKMWYKNGQVLRNQFYLHRKMEGEFKSWHVNGRPYVRAFYRKGVLEGECKSWRINGRIAIREFYRNGKDVDLDFSMSKKLIFVRIRNNLQSRKLEPFSNFLIRDLNSG